MLPRRRAARRTALFLLYQWDLTGQPLGTNYEGEIDEFARGLAEAVAAHADELDARISAVSGDWPAKQLGTLERNILRIGVYELQEGTVPLEVAIDEAVTLAKRYASEDAGRLVNGILGTIAQERSAGVSDASTERGATRLGAAADEQELEVAVEAATLEQAIDLLGRVRRGGEGADRRDRPREAGRRCARLRS